MYRGLLLASVWGLMVVIGGCGKSDPRQHHVSGSVLFKDEPLVDGRIDFTPDTTKQNTGPQGTALIKDGKFDTRTAGGVATVGGPLIVEITGFARRDVISCRYKFELDLPKQTSTHTQDIAIPATAAVKPIGSDADGF